MKAMVNGEITTQIDVYDRGLQFGDGVFETMAVSEGVIRHFGLHFQRLERGCRALKLEPPERAALLQEINRLLAHDEGHAAGKVVVKFVLTRGAGERGYAPPEAPACNRILYLSQWPQNLEKQARDGIEITFCQTRLGLNPALAGVKHLNRLEQVLASAEIAGSGFTHGVMLDIRGQVIEATNSNLFIVEKKQLVTPSLEHCGVAGVTRERLLLLAAKNGIVASVETVSRDRLNDCDEVFLCNSIAGILPVTAIEQRRIDAGPITRELQALLQSEDAS